MNSPTSRNSTGEKKEVRWGGKKTQKEIVMCPTVCGDNSASVFITNSLQKNQGLGITLGQQWLSCSSGISIQHGYKRRALIANAGK